MSGASRSTRTSMSTRRSPTTRSRTVAENVAGRAGARTAHALPRRSRAAGHRLGARASPPPWRPTGTSRGLRVLAGVEAKILDTAGRLDLPAAAWTASTSVLIADHQFPADERPGCTRTEVRAAIERRGADRRGAIEQLCEATANALEATGPRAAARPPVQPAAQDRARRGHGAGTAAGAAGRTGRPGGRHGRGEREMVVPVGPHGRRAGSGRRAAGGGQRQPPLP